MNTLDTDKLWYTYYNNNTIHLMYLIVLYVTLLYILVNNLWKKFKLFEIVFRFKY